MYLVDDPATGARRVVEIWLDDGDRLLVVASLSEASVSEISIPFDLDAPIVATMNVGGSDVSVIANVQRSANPCDTMFLEGADGSFFAYGVSDVCQAEGYTVATLNTWWDASGTHAHSESTFSFEAGPSSIQFRNAGTYEQLTAAELFRSAKTEDIASTFDKDGQPWTLALGIDQNPEGGHECVLGWVAD